MKILNSTVKTIAALCIIGALFFSCSTNDTDERGTLVIKLPGSASARNAFTDFTELKYRIECGNSLEKVSLNAGSGVSFSISLSPGKWTVTLTALDAADQKIGSSEPETAVIKGGKTTSISIYVALDEYPYWGETLELFGQVYGGESQDYNFDKPYDHNADVYVKENTGGTGKISEGKLTFIIGAPGTKVSLKELLQKTDMYSNMDLSHDNAKGAFLDLGAESLKSGNNYTLRKKSITDTPPSTITEGVDYLYVDRDVTITAESDLNLNLKKGWNALYSKETITGNTGTFSLSLHNPALKWVLEFHGNDGSDSEPGKQ